MVNKIRNSARWMRWLFAGVVLAGIGLYAGEQVANATNPDPDAQGIVTGLQSYATDALSKLGPKVDDTADHLSYLANKIPLSDLAPLSNSGLDFTDPNNPLRQAINSVTGNEANVTDLANALDAVNADFGGVHVTLGCGDNTHSCGHAVSITGSGPYALTLPVSITRDVHVPLHLASDVQDFLGPNDNAHDLTIQLAATGTLSFGYDASRPANHQFFLNAPSGSPSTLSLSANINSGALGSFPTDLGFTKVTLTPSINTASVGLGISLTSPHDVGDSEAGVISAYDWQTTAPQDLVTVTRSGSIDASLAVDTDLTAASPDLTVHVSAAASDGFKPHFDVGGSPTDSLQSVLSSQSISDFLNVSPTKILTGLGQLAASVQALQTSANVNLPFLKDGLTSPTGGSALKIVTDLIASLAQQTVVCGSDNSTNPPSGSLLGLAAGTKVYCEATTTDSVDAGSIQWSALAGTATPSATPPNNTSGAAADGTISAAPSKKAVFETAFDDVPPIITANYTVASAPKGVSMPVPTAQDLVNQLETTAGLGDTVAGHDAPGLSYDSDSHTLKFHLVKKIATPDPVAASFDFADRLKNSSGLLGLSEGSGASVTAQATDVVVDLTFGVVLVKDLNDISTHSDPPTDLDRFFVQGPSSGPILSLADASVNANVKLAGQVGFLGITAQGASSADCASAPSAAFCLLKDDSTKPILSVDLKDTGTITVDSHDVDNALSIPELLSHISDHVTVTPNMKLAGGLSVSADINGDNLASGGVQFTWPIDSLDELTSASQLNITTDSQFSQSLQKFWEMAKNDPTALLKIVLDALRDLAQKQATGSGGVMDTQLPLVNTTPRKLMQQFNRLETAVDEITTGSGAVITCTNVTGQAANPQRDASGAINGDHLTCRATTTTGDPTSVSWKVIAADSLVAGTTGDTDLTTVGANPTTDFSFTLPAGPPNISGFAAGATTKGYHVHVDYADATNSHTGDLPALSSPKTLQALADYLAAKLGLPPNVITATVFQAHKAGANGGGDPTVPTLKFGLKYDICTADTSQVGDCGTDGMHIPALDFPISTTLGDVGGGLAPSLQTNGKVSLQFNAHAEFDLGFPLDGGIDTLPTPEVLGSTGGSIAVAASGDNLGAKASLGPLSVELGSLATQPDPNNQTLQSFRVGGKVTLGESGSPADTDAFSPGDFISGLNIAFDNNGSASSCGQVDPNFTDDTTNPDPTPPVDTTGFACAAVTMNLNGTFIGDLGMYWPDFNGSPQFIIPTDLGDRIANAAFNIDFLLKALPQLLDQLKATLSNANGKQKLPIIGDALDAGANIVGQLNDNIVTPAVNGISAAIGAIGSPKEMVDKVDGFLFDHLGPSGANLLLDTNGDSSVTAADVGLKLTCKDSSNSGNPYDCSTSTNTGSGDGTVFSIQDAQVDMQLGQGIGTDPNTSVSACADPNNNTCDHSHDIPFDFGVDGLPFRVTGKLVPNVGWKAHLNFGIDRNGPYLVVNHSTNDVQIGAGIGLGDPGSGLCTENSHVLGLLNSEPDYSTFKNTNCVHGTLGFLEVTATDTDGTDTSLPRTGVHLSAGVKLIDDADHTALAHIGLANLTDLSARFTIKADAHANLLIHAGIQGAGNGFPSVYGVLKANWDWGFSAGHEDPTDSDTLGSNSTPTPGVSFDALRVDIGELLNNYLNPIFQQIKSVTSPLKPVIDVLQAPIPVVSQLAELVGQPPVTLIDLAAAASGSDLSFVKSIISFLHFVDSFTPSQSGLLNLDFLTGGGAGSAGSFDVNPSLLNTPQPETAASDLVKNAHSSDALGGISGANDTAMVEGRQSTFGVPGLGIPVFKDPSNVFKLLMGTNITLIDYDFGQLKATAGFEYTFGPFMVGPVPVSIIIGGSVEVHANLWIGYDTTGIREVLNGGPADKLLDGLFFNTYRDGKEVPVIALIGTVYAGAEVDLEIIKAGIEAGLTLTVNFFFDDPTPDGKMSFQDIGSKLSNPICLFRVSGSLDAFIKAFVEIDLFFFSDRFEFTILQLHLLDFNASCDPPTPEPARVDGHVLKLNIGPDASKRNIQTDQKDEKIVVRPLDPSTGKQFGVTIFGAYKEYGDTNPAGANHITSIFGDGADGKDDIELLPGAQTSGTGPDGKGGTKTCTSASPCTLAFDTPAVLHGGADDDTLIGGSGDDQLFGDGGVDKITGSGGNDLLVGGGGGDQLDGGLGNDKLCSGTWSGTDCTPAAESTTESGGPGDDQLWGSTAGDQLNGGPGLDPNAKDPDHPGQTFGQTKTAELDGNDTIVGFAGTDSINGGPGDDTIYGDEVIANDFACAQAGQDAPDHASDPTNQFNNDVIEAGTGSDKVWAGSGDDLVKGGSGTDGVVATGDNDFLCGNGGNDTIEGDPTDGSATGNDAVLGGPGNDILTGGPGNDYVDGGSGNDSVSGGVGDDVVVGGTGRDYVNGEDGKDIVVGESADVTEYDKTTGALSIDHSGSSTVMAGFVSNVDETTSADTPLNCGAAYVQTDTTDGNSDCVSGGNNDDALFGGGGPDTMNGDAGDDWMSGGANADSMHGSAGNDVMYGDAGDDQMMGDSGDDTMYGGLDNDTMHGSTGADYMEGNQGADSMFGDEQNDHMIGGSSTSGTADQNFDFGGFVGSIGDTMSGGAGQDTMVGDNGKIAGDGQAVVFDDCSSTGGDDQMTGDDSGDWMFGGNGNDTMSGGGGADKMEGNAGSDTMHGDVNDDQMVGGSSNDTSTGGGAPQSYTLACDAGDTMFGDVGNDVMLGDNGVIAPDGTTTQSTSLPGTFGNDTMRGGDGQDQMYGELGSDTMTGDAGEDYMLGDLGSITAPGSGPAIWPGGAPNETVALIAPDDPNVGQDVMYGGPADDHMYGGGANDTMQGGGGDDYMEGNDGQDSMYGRDDNIDGSTCSNGVSPFDCSEATLAASDTSADQDDMIGGSSGANPLPEKLDAGELIMKGNLGQDVMIGDNGTITRTVDGADPTKWAQDPITGGAKRTVSLTYSDRADCSTNVCGNDTMEGGAANDRIYGEGGNDTIDGDATSHAITGAPGDDYVEGNQGTDTIHGNDGRDDLIGGSSEIASGSGDAAVGRPDANDNVFGDAGADVIAGDNAVVSKLGVCPNGGTGDPITQRLGMTDCQRTIRLLDLTVGLSRTSTPGTFGGDTLNGGDDTDVIFGQAGQDAIHGDTGDDYIEGNQDADTINGDAGQDDIIGGSSHVFSGSAANKTAVGEADAADMIFGNDGQDVVLGDNGAILRVGTTAPGTRANTLEDATKNRNGMAQRTIALYDLGDTPTAGNSGADYIEGNGDSDVLLGQDGTDRIKGGAGDDYIEGNQGTDALEGNDGDDDIIGGSSTPLAGVQSVSPTFVPVPAPTDATVGEPDAADLIYGGGGDDLITGDNGVTSRVGATASYLLNRISTTNPGNVVTPRFLQLLDLKQGATYLPQPSLNRFGADWISAGSGTDVAFGQDGNDAISGGGGDDYIEGNGGADVIRGDLLLGDTPPNDPGRVLPVVNTPETPQVAPPSAGWPGSPSGGSDLDGTGATPAGQDDILGGSSIPGFRDTADTLEGDGEGDFVLGDNGTLARDVTGSPGSLKNAVFTARYPAGAAPANAVIVRHHDQAENVKYGTLFTGTRFCTQANGAAPTASCEVVGAFGDDHIYGDTGDDTLFGQDGNDWMRGGNGADDMYGETGKDLMFGDEGQDAMLGDRGGIVDTYINGTPGGNSTDARFPTATITFNNPPAVNYKYFVAGTVDRRVDMLHEADGAAFVGTGAASPMPLNGVSFGDNDTMRGGYGKDTMHGGTGDDIMNGDSGGDTLYGDDGADVMWGGRGCDPTSPDDAMPTGQPCAYPSNATEEGTAAAFLNIRDSVERTPSTNTAFTLPDGFVDYEFGGHGGTSAASVAGALGSDIIDWRPRGSFAHPGPGSDPNSTCANDTLWPAQPGTAGKKTTVDPIDPCEWFIDTNSNDDPAVSASPATDPAIQNNQTHQGIDWILGGWDRDVLQADVASNGPNDGDKLMDWNGAYNLYTHCNSAYGGFNDVRNSNPATTNFDLTWAMATGAGQIGTNDIGTAGTSAFDDIAFVYNSDNNENSGKAYPSTPGHFDAPNACGL